MGQRQAIASFTSRSHRKRLREKRKNHVGNRYMRRRRAMNIGLGLAGGALVGLTPIAASAKSLIPSRALKSLRVKLVNALTRANNIGCSAAAERVADSGSSTVSLHVRGVDLTVPALRQITQAISALNHGEARLLTSVSVSYNPALSDAGAQTLADSLPSVLPELGMVGCEVTDVGGRALLAWAERAKGLRMLCIEENQFSASMVARFRKLADTKPGLSLFI